MNRGSVKEKKKLPPVNAPYSNVPVTNQELKKRKRKYDRLKALGVDPTLFVCENEESENPYLIQAMVIINQDRDVPLELIEKIKEYDNQRNTQRDTHK